MIAVTVEALGPTHSFSWQSALPHCKLRDVHWCMCQQTDGSQSASFSLRGAGTTPYASVRSVILTLARIHHI